MCVSRRGGRTPSDDARAHKQLSHRRREGAAGCSQPDRPRLCGGRLGVEAADEDARSTQGHELCSMQPVSAPRQGERPGTGASLQVLLGLGVAVRRMQQATRPDVLTRVEALVTFCAKLSAACELPRGSESMVKWRNAANACGADGLHMICGQAPPPRLVRPSSVSRLTTMGDGVNLGPVGKRSKNGIGP